MSRYESKNIKLGKSYFLGVDEGLLKKQQAILEAETIIEKAKQQADAIIQQGKVEAENYLKNAENEKDKLIQDANLEIEESKKQGFKEGYDAGQKQISSEMENTVLMIDNFAKVTFDVKRKLIKSAHTDIVNLIVEIAKKVSMGYLNIDTKFLMTLVEDAIARLPEKEFVTIILNPKLAEKIYAITPELKQKLEKAEHIKFVENPSLSADGTIVESGDTRIDTRLSTQLATIESKLMEHLNSYTEDDLVAMSDTDAGVSEQNEDI